ncbi:MipA/OmpV family protein [Aureimonas jatrophae]|jgi:MipA family protein|uniref:Outer membrane scaffolding protein for murein synthesis, MipA/OmpV family n=1 Tax=Aureimonas jatrophae TaxID=1166073 RepID=A0A1H0IQ71_9HYPH|nr:MipA/OmpV family protein [Aureimonas jatrophae]MBB3952295.1 outer membrane scaffolding protein for murein synthesis (MipA/OmpV family) [Aureimonas jatrophae]SDO33470.1 Outer membrane scaffolding protein for murein synthesis, MipA/OmpV family [Aureimonas jatrophae]
MSIRAVVLALSASALIGSAALAADVYTPDTTEVAIVNNADLIIELGAGVSTQPAYEGADDYIVSGFPIVDLQYLSIPGLFDIGSPDEQQGGLRIGPSFRFIDKRNAADYPELLGTLPLDDSYQIGLRAGYEFPVYETLNIEVYGAARYAFNEGEGFVGDAGFDLISRPTPDLEFKLGPRTSFADSDYMDTYFAVKPIEALGSFGGLRAYDTSGGFKSVGVAASARYEFRPDWFLNANAAWDRLVGDAADSPIAEVGSENQFFAGIGLSRRFNFDLF